MMPIEVVRKVETRPVYLNQVFPLRPIVIKDIKPCYEHGCKEMPARERAVREKVRTGDICVRLDDHGTHCPRILHCPSGVLLEQWAADYILFEYDDNVARVVIAKPEN